MATCTFDMRGTTTKGPISVHESSFNPYTDNKGSIAGIAGDNFCIIATDTRQSEGYSIHSRISKKSYKLTDKAVLATSGFHADGLAFFKQLQVQLEMYQYQHDKEMSVQSIAQCASIELYSHRFFPYYTFNILGGLDENGKGAIYSYDPVGSFEREEYRAGGSAASLIQPFLDNQVGGKNLNSHNNDITSTTGNAENTNTNTNSGRNSLPPLTKERAISLLKDAFTSATERDIYTGDGLDIWVITKEGIELRKFELKKD